MENNFIALVEGFTCDGIFKFGKHKGKSFVEVATSRDADYFMWLWGESNPKYKTAFAHDTSWAKRNEYEMLELYLDKDLKEFIEKNFERLKKEAKICKHIHEAELYEERMRDW